MQVMATKYAGQVECRWGVKSVQLPTSSENKDFNLGRVLFSCENHSRLFRQNRIISAI